MAETAARALCEALLTLTLFGGATALFALVCEAVKAAWHDTHTH